MPQNSSVHGTVFESIRPFEVHYDNLDALYEYLNEVFQYLLVNETNQEERPELKRFVLDLIAFHTRIMEEILAPLDNRIAEYNQKRAAQEQLLAEQEQLRQKLRLLQEQVQQITQETHPRFQNVESDVDDFTMPSGPDLDPFTHEPASPAFDFDVPDDVKDMLVETEMPDDDNLFEPDEFDLPIHDRNDSRGIGFVDDYDDPMRPGSTLSSEEESTGITGAMVNMLDNLEDHDEEIEREAEYEVHPFDPDNLFSIDNVETFDDLRGTTDTFRPIYGNEKEENRDSSRQQGASGRNSGSSQDDNDVGFIFDDLDDNA